MCMKFASFFDTLKLRGIRLQHASCKENECAAVNSVCVSEEKFKKVFEMNPLIIGVNGNFHRE